VRKFYQSLYSAGFLLPSTEMLHKDSSLLKLRVFKGKKFRWAKISPGNLPTDFQHKPLFRESLMFGDPVSPAIFSKMHKKALEAFQNTGYPFAMVGIDNISINQNQIDASWNVRTGPLVTIDSLTTTGSSNIAPAYLRNFLGIKPGKPYNESLFRLVQKRLRGLPFLQISAPPKIEFFENKVRLRLFLEKRNASIFNGVIGIMPANDIDGEVLLTGDIQLRLHSVLGRAELLEIQWRRIQQKTQDLKIQASYPFLLNLPIGLEGKFNLFRIDTAFYSIDLQAAVQYILPGANTIKAFYNYQTSRKVLDEKGQSTLIGLANQDVHLYGLGANIERLDYRVNPRQGFSLKGSASLGYKQLFSSGNDTVNSTDSLPQRSIHGLFQAYVDGYIPISRRWVVKLGAQGGFIYNATLFRNELLRIGGLRSVRGFDEESIYASLYSVGTVELRLLIDEDSYINIFSDGGYMQRNIRGEEYATYLVGFGAGITFATKVGSFSFNYALGTDRDQNIEFRRSKIHFGYVNYF
jgi:outer membrane protein assembly factor BamA